MTSWRESCDLKPVAEKQRHVGGWDLIIECNRRINFSTTSPIFSENQKSYRKSKLTSTRSCTYVPPRRSTVDSCSHLDTMISSFGSSCRSTERNLMWRSSAATPTLSRVGVGSASPALPPPQNYKTPIDPLSAESL